MATKRDSGRAPAPAPEDRQGRWTPTDYGTKSRAYYSESSNGDPAGVQYRGVEEAAPDSDRRSPTSDSKAAKYARGGLVKPKVGGTATSPTVNHKKGR